MLNEAILLAKAVSLLFMQLPSGPQTFRRKEAKRFQAKMMDVLLLKKTLNRQHLNIVLPVSPESIPLTSLQQSCLNYLRYCWFKTPLLKFEAIFCYYTTRGGYRRDVGYAAYAFPHQPFPTMFWMNKIFP